MIKRSLGGILLSGMISGAALAGSWDDGWVAYDRGDFAGALRFWEPLADSGFPAVQMNVAAMYLERDPTAAAEWYRRAADQGYAPAQFNLGVMYERGLGVPLDNAEAAKWYSLSAEQGNSNAQFNLAYLYASGLGVSRDLVTAYIWFSRAASQGDDDAETNRGVIKRLLTRDQIEYAEELARELEATLESGLNRQ